jgi:hypothetical protein
VSAVLNRHLGPIASIDANIEQRATRRSTTPELDQIEPQRLNLLPDEAFQRLKHISSKKPAQEQKNAGEPSPTFPDHGCLPREAR